MRFIPILALVAFTTFFVEFVVGRSILTFLDPTTFLFLLVGYGLVILVMRELAVKWKIGIRGLLLWGLSYGIINEGLLAKTMIMSQNLPVNHYDMYGVVGGISVPWSVAISLWHAVAAVLIPILLVHALLPKYKDEQWLNTKMTYILGIVLMLLMSAAFIGEQPLRGTPGQLILLLGFMAALFALGVVFKGDLKVAEASRIKPLLLGLSVIIPFWILAFIAAAKLPVPLFFLVYIGVILLYSWIIQRNSWNSVPTILYFGIGWYLHNTIQAAVILLVTNPVALIQVPIALLLLGLLYWRLRRV